MYYYHPGSQKKKKINKDKSLRLRPLENSNKKTGKYLEMWMSRFSILGGEEGVLASCQSIKAYPNS